MQLETTIRSVSVYPARARIIRQGTLHLEKGRQQVEIANLPEQIDPGSVRIAGRGSAKARFLNVDVLPVHFAVTPSPRAGQLIAEIEQLEEQERDLSDQLATQEKQSEHLDTLLDNSKIYAANLSRGRLSLEAHLAMLDEVSRRRDQTQDHMRQLNMQKRETSRQLEKLRKELAELRSEQPLRRNTIVTDWEVLTAGEITIDIMYTIAGASWKPLYDIRLLDDELETTLLAEITQATGEDWPQVALTLSTASPALTAIAPELGPWFLSPVPVPQPHRARQMAAASVTAAKPAPASPQRGQGFAVAQESQVADAVQAEVVDQGASTTYQTSHRVDIPSDNHPHKTTIAEFRLPLTMDYLTTPKLATAAYRRIKVRNSGEHMLLAGQAQLFDGDSYIGSAKLEQTSPGQELTLYFGTDERIRVERELVRRETDKKFMADVRRIRFGYRIEIENHSGKEQLITVCDQVPVPRHEEIKVKIEQSSPKHDRQDELFRLEWDLRLASGARSEIRFDFSVEHPRDMMLRGLP